ncbi:Mini-ribonuclease 3 [Lactiplantibacillus mudanjiangensis]|uniref:Mini-ribonuclease 3 n=1 Tax=Lactiplantibacillus mudanjiangensis TaxID=1296538 RepID=A0A660DXI5_9LACO|nr:Mini-ribonuclease 3 [Lactiplantibacillus mudanjiangensis]VDG18004.1 Mini-ribonuclease 3 [Lactobacillus sp.] [Lactiplantibacillus mudanjiangensis]VDG24830.1 Mini-ribonuclease 3 [Lactobacillus sp.] [Lactiplantibacillus mudanjiangensis]VDG28423.1 Mini-ribonuclease 3 [Lactobacillus sp.] [Lactiplantibacillus mudanjiangensis]VDG32293.1 Mini-ribonuclease 3 [Lactobacillus sp.] [Lactiplantibacillus mudanjiangensis]
MTVDYQQLNGIALAYLGDAVYEPFIRQHLIEIGFTKPTKLHHHATHYVSAKAQAALIALMETDGVLTETETEVFKRGRNAKSHTSAKHTDVLTYRVSTGFEAVFGYLQLTEQTARIAELASWCIKQVDEGRVSNGR